MARVKITKAEYRKNTRVGACLGMAVFLAALTGLNCSRASAPEDPAWFQSTESGAVLGRAELAKKIEGAEDLFQLDDMKRDYVLRNAEPEEAILAALDAKRDQLVEKADAFPAVPGALNFLGWKIKRLGEGPVVQGTPTRKYQVSGYFVVTGKMDRDWGFKVMTKVDDQHAQMLPPDRQSAKYINWQVFPQTSTWEPGEHYILSAEVQLMPIPYYIYARMYVAKPEIINHGVFTYGWYADPADSPKAD